MRQMGKRVWILGAGFSRSLGGPLLPDLLSNNMREEIRARLRVTGEKLAWDDLAKKVYELFNMRYAWSEAESFLEFIDAAATPETPQYKRLPLEVRDKAAELSRKARRLVAAECVAFLTSNPPVVGSGKDAVIPERWRPYARWVQNLTADDTVISFNYDLVIENLRSALQKADAEGADLGGLQLRVITTANDLAKPGFAKVLKLHGSVDWALDPRGEDRVWAKGCPWLEDDRIEPVIGTPGPGKFDATQNLGWLWRAAEGAIRSAEEMILVGYRFPESDGYAREALLDALRDSNVQRVHSVLGRSSPDAERLKYLLQMSRAKAQPLVLPLFAEDFLQRWDADWRTRP